jgi:hypothetical protein
LSKKKESRTKKKHLALKVDTQNLMNPFIKVAENLVKTEKIPSLPHNPFSLANPASLTLHSTGWL